jgi:hypothetical protein
MAGLDPAIDHQKTLAKKMEHRVKPADDGVALLRPSPHLVERDTDLLSPAPDGVAGQGRAVGHQYESLPQPLAAGQAQTRAAAETL